MSLRLRLLTAVCRRIAKPRLRRVTPAAARLDFDRFTRIALPAPPLTRHLVRPGGLHWLGLGHTRHDRVILWVHGGAYVAGSPHTHARMLAHLSALTATEICAPDYRLAPEHPFPAGHDDVADAWDALRRLGYAPRDVILGGDSAGGGLALALLARLCAQGTPPAGAVLMAPLCDLTATGDSWTAHRGRDPLLPAERLAEMNALYLGGTDPSDPRVSPLRAEFPGCPPVWLSWSGTEILASDCAALADRLQAQGTPVFRHVHPTAPHVWPLFADRVPESWASLRDAARFCQASFAASRR